MVWFVSLFTKAVCMNLIESLFTLKTITKDNSHPHQHDKHNAVLSSSNAQFLKECFYCSSAGKIYF